MTKRIVVSFVVLAVVAALAPTAQAQSIRRWNAQYWANQTVRDFSYSGYYTQPGWMYNEIAGRIGGYGYDTPDWGHRQATQNNANARGANNAFLGGANLYVNVRNGRKIDQIWRDQAELMYGQQAMYDRMTATENQRRYETPERTAPQRSDEYAPERISASPVAQMFLYSNWTPCVVLMTNDRLNQQQAIKPGMTLRIRWDPQDVRAYSHIEGQFQELGLEVEGNDVAITAPSGN